MPRFLVVVIIGVAFLFLTRWLFMTPQSGPHAAPNGLTRLALCGVAVSTGTCVAGPPLGLLNLGLIAYLLIYVFSTRVVDRTTSLTGPSSAADHPIVATQSSSKQVSP